MVCHPKSQGGLGIMNLEVMKTALRVRWAWNLRADGKKPWYFLVVP
jgi:hypothetical protein